MNAARENYPEIKIKKQSCGIFNNKTQEITNKHITATMNLINLHMLWSSMSNLCS